MIASINIVDQKIINDRGEIIEIKQLTRNQSKVYEASGKSVNSRFSKDDIQECMYGHFLLHDIHFVVAIRADHPDKQVFI